MRRLFYSAIFLFSFLSFHSTSFSQAFSLVRDVNPGPEYDPIRPTDLTEAGGLKMQWQLTDNTGKTIKKGFYNLYAGSTAVSIDIANLSSGIYLLQLNGTTLQKVFKVRKQ